MPTGRKKNTTNKKTTQQTIIQSQLADLCGVSSAAVVQWGRGENPPPRNMDGSYPAREVGEWMRRHLVNKPGPDGDFPWRPAPVPKAKLRDEAARLKVAQAEKIEMENEVRAGQLVEVDRVRTIWADILKRVQTKMLRIPVAVSPLLIGETDILSIQEKLKDSVHDALAEASVDWEGDDDAGL